MDRGHSYIELTLVVAIAGMTVASLAPAARAFRDRASVVGAREAAVGMVSSTRRRAIARGSAVLRVSSVEGTASTLDADSIRRSVSFVDDFGVEVALSRGRAVVDLSFDALGLGQVASETLTFRRGGAVARVVLSSYGRVRRE